MGTEPGRAEQIAAARELLDRARAECLRGSLDRAWHACTEVAAVGRSLGDGALVADAATVIPGTTVGTWSLTAARHAMAREALAMIGSNDPDRAELLRAVLVATQSPWTAAEPLPSQALTPIEADQRSARVHARYSIAAGPDRPRELLNCADELAQIAAGGREEDAAWASLWRVEAYTQLGRRLELNAEFMRLTAAVRRLGAPVWNWRLAAARASLALMDGHVDDARQLSDTALREGQRAGAEEASFVDLVLRSSLARQTGVGLAEIEPQVRQAIADGPLFAQGWRAGLLLALGRTAEALAIWRALAPHLEDLPPAAPEWLVATSGHVELCAAANDAASAERLITLLEPYAELHIGGGYTPYEGPVSLSLAKLAQTLGRFGAARDYLRDALARAERLHAPIFAAAASAALGRISDQAGPLTVRELEVAQLVGSGLTNRQIAARLVLSERTVENHVSSILRKLGVSRAGIGTAIAHRPVG